MVLLTVYKILSNQVERLVQEEKLKSAICQRNQPLVVNCITNSCIGATNVTVTSTLAIPRRLGNTYMERALALRSWSLPVAMGQLPFDFFRPISYSLIMLPSASLTHSLSCSI